MSTVFPAKQICSVCGSEVSVLTLGSTNAFGSPDLDLRPPEMQRSTMPMWVQRCPHCGYVADDLSDPTDVTAQWLAEVVAPVCEARRFKSELASKLYAAHLIAAQEEAGYRPVYRYALFAAWACDDAGDTENAVFCRGKAIEILQPFCAASEETDTTETLILADMLRRCGRFDEVQSLLTGCAMTNETEEKVRDFALQKAAQQDDRRYLISDALAAPQA